MVNPAYGNASAEVLSEPAYWSPLLNILFVVDGRINTSKDPQSFGLGYVLETLRGSDQFVRLNVEVVRRDGGVLVLPGLSGPEGDGYYNSDRRKPITNFVFTAEYLAGWDQVWLFGDFPSNLSDNHTESRFSPLSDSELKCLAEWMDRGGGVFAAGDHWNLGASMCSRIPRVRSMRRWTPGQRVPPMDGDARHQTLQPNPNIGNPDLLEGDTYAQPVEVVHWSVTASDLLRPWFPHALLATPNGAIETFPDHMHEGDVVLDDQVQLDNALDIPNYQQPEYPYAEIAVSTGTSARISVNNWLFRPRPHVVAYGRTTNPSPPVTSVVFDAAAASPVVDVPTLTTKRFAMIGAYDGDSAGIGRVVVESTWHHWFSFNLHGFVEAASRRNNQYELMQIYYRNVAIWLATPAQRQSMLSAIAWRTVVSNSMAFPLVPPRTLWAVGEHVLGVVSQTLSPSMLVDCVASIYSGRPQIFSTPGGVDSSSPYSGSVPADLAMRAILGGIAASFVKPAYDYLGAGPRPLLDPHAIARHFADGVALGHDALVGTINDRAAAASRVVDTLQRTFKPSSALVPIALVGLRVVVEAIQFPDPTDPCLATRNVAAGKFEHVCLTLRMTLGRAIVANDVVHRIDIGTFGPAGALVELDRVLYEGIVQSGEVLVVEVLAGEAEAGAMATERLRFNDTLTGDPLGWVGAHVPGRSQLWRLWYRIETGLGEL